MANPNGTIENLNHTLTKEEQRLGGINSGISRRENASLKKSLVKLLNCGFKLPTNIVDNDIKDFVGKLNSIGIDTNNMPLTDLITCGQILSAIGGKADNYKTLLEVNGETEIVQQGTPNIEINVVDNSNLEKAMYETNRHNQDDNGQ